MTDGLSVFGANMVAVALPAINAGMCPVSDPDQHVPFSVPDTAGYDLTLLLVIFGLALLMTSYIVVSELRGQRDSASVRRLLIAVCCLGVIALVSYRYFGPVSIEVRGESTRCGYGESAAELAGMRGVPNDSVLTDELRRCRHDAQIQLGVGVGLLLFTAVSLVVIARATRRVARTVPVDGGFSGQRRASRHGRT